MDTSFVSFIAALDPLVLMLATGALVILMLHASAAKLGDRDLFMQHLAAYGVPDAALGAMTWALPLAELVAALGLMTPWRALAAGLCAVLLATYAAAMAWQLAHGRRPDCGCGGEPLPLSWALVVRNVALLGLAGLAALPSGDRAITAGDIAAVVAGWLLLTLLYAAFNQVLRQAAHLDHLDRQRHQSHSSHSSLSSRSST